MRVYSEVRGNFFGEVVSELSAGDEIGEEVFQFRSEFIEAAAEARFRDEEPAGKFVCLLFDRVFFAAVCLVPAGEIREGSEVGRLRQGSMEKIVREFVGDGEAKPV